MFDIVQYTRTFFSIDNKANVENWTKIFNQMAVHTRKRKPEELLLAMRPNEEDYIHKYRLANYRPITYGSMNRAMDSVGRLLNKIQYDVVCEENVKAYLAKKQFVGQNTAYDFYTWNEKITFKYDIEDPNGYLLWLPTGAGIEDNGQEVEPKPFFFSLDKIVEISPDVCSFLSDETAPIRGSDGKVTNDGLVYYIVDKQWFYKLVQISKDKRVKFRLDYIYEHKIGEIPGFVLGGDMNAEGYFESFFGPYCAFGDEAINTFSDWQAIKVTSGFPYTEEFYTECEIKIAEKLSDPIPKGEKKYSKKTSFEKFPRTPFNTIMRKIPGNKSDSEITGERILPADIPSKRFISPDIEVLRYCGESWEKLIEMAEDSLHLNLGTGTNQSGVAKEKDLEQSQAMIDKIGTNYYSHIMFNSVKFIDCYINRKTFEESEVAINVPATFTIPSEMDLVEEIGTLKEKNAPSIFLAEATTQLAKRRFNANPISKRIFDLVSIVDPLFIYGLSEKQQMVMSGGVTKDAYISSIYAYSILQRLSMTMQDFLTATVEKIEGLYLEQLKKYLVVETPSFDPAGNPL